MLSHTIATPTRTAAYADIHDVVSGDLRTLKSNLDDPTAPIVVIAHSLGAHIMSNYVWDRQHWKGGADPLEGIHTLVSMISFGCNVPLFSLSFDVARPINLPGRAITRPALKTAARWLNYLDKDDVLGWPMKTLYRKNLAKLTKAQRATVNKIRDYEDRCWELGDRLESRVTQRLLDRQRLHAAGGRASAPDSLCDTVERST